MAKKELTAEQKLKTDVQDLLNQIVLKLKDVKELEVEFDDYRYTVGGPEEIYNDETGEYEENPITDDEKYLFPVKKICSLMAKGEAEHIVTQYYNSNC